MEGGEHVLTTQNWKSQQQKEAWKRPPDTTAHESCLVATSASHLLVMESMAALSPSQTDTGCTLEKLHWFQQHCQSSYATCPFAIKHLRTASVHPMMLFGLDPMGMGREMPALIQGSTCLSNPDLWCSLCCWAAYSTPDTPNWGSKLKFWCTWGYQPFKISPKSSPVLWAVGSLLCLAGHRHPAWTRHKPPAG